MTEEQHAAAGRVLEQIRELKSAKTSIENAISVRQREMDRRGRYIKLVFGGEKMGDMELNFDVLRDMGLTAIRCYNPEQAKVLLDEMFRQYPKLVEKYWSDRDPRWEECQPDTTYALHIFDKKIDTMQIADEAYWKSHRYTIVNFSDLIYTAIDYGEIKLFENSINSLFGMW